MRWASAYSRHGSCEGQVRQIFLAFSTPTPSLGKNLLGGYSLQAPSAIQFLSILEETYN